MTTNQRLLPYRDLTAHYPAPTTGQPASAGWWRQAGHNYAIMANAAQIRGAAESAATGWVQWSPSWTGITLQSPDNNLGGWVQVGQIVYVWARCWVQALSTEPAALADLPVPPADSMLPMHAGYGYLFDGTLDRAPFAAEIDVDTGGLGFYWARASTSGQIIEGDPLSISGTGEISVYASYRVEPPPGTLNGFSYIVDAQEQP